MSIFTNIHKIASMMIPKQVIYWRKGLGRTVSPAGIPKSVYGEWVKVRAHVQPGIISSFGGKNITEKDYKDMGLDWSHRFFTIWLDEEAIATIAQQSTTDQIKIGEEIFNVIQMADWEEFNGWRRCYCEQVINNQV